VWEGFLSSLAVEFLLIRSQSVHTRIELLLLLIECLLSLVVLNLPLIGFDPIKLVTFFYRDMIWLWWRNISPGSNRIIIRLPNSVLMCQIFSTTV
jgi:hypothetical protein